MAKMMSNGRARIGALLVLSVCFAASGLMRVGDVVAALPAGGDDGFGNPLPAARVANQTQVPQSQETDAPEVLVAELKRRTDALNERERAVEAREIKLKALQERLNLRLNEVREARDRLAKTAALVDDAAGKDVRRLAKMYQQMKPKKAGEIFNEMAPSFAAGFLAEMTPDAAALVMSNMTAERAYAVSLLLAGRNIKQ